VNLIVIFALSAAAAFAEEIAEALKEVIEDL
jgi:hypothetical protein